MNTLGDPLPYVIALEFVAVVVVLWTLSLLIWHDWDGDRSSSAVPKAAVPQRRSHAGTKATASPSAVTVQSESEAEPSISLTKTSPKVVMSRETTN
jgi:hypothetical protein